MEFEFSGEEIARALRSEGREPVTQVLIGSSFYRDDPEELFEIVSFDNLTQTLAIRGPSGDRRLTLGAFEAGYVVEQRAASAIAPALQASKSPFDRERERAELVLAQSGIRSRGIPLEDQFALARTMEDHCNGRLPSKVERDARYKLFRVHDLHRKGAEVVDRWRQLVEATGELVDADIHIKLACCYRHSGQLQLAFQTTDVVELPANIIRISHVQKAILACERAAISLDLYEYDRAVDRLKVARSYAALAWHIQPSGECSNVYERLKRFEAELEDARFSDARERQLARIRNPYDVARRR